MLYGPAGAGKTHAVEAVANELGALLIHLTPAKLKGQFTGKSGPTKLVHMVMTVARDPAMQPVVIYIDECEQFFTGGKKNKDKDGPSRFKKDLLLYKNQALSPEHRVVVIGTTKNPENGDVKDMKSFFDKFLYFPFPDYSSRVLLWKHFLTQQIREGLRFYEGLISSFYIHVLGVNNRLCLIGGQGTGKKGASATSISNATNPTLPNAAFEEEIAQTIRFALERLSLSSLAHISEGYSAGAIARTVRIIVTPRRVGLYSTIINYLFYLYTF